MSCLTNQASKPAGETRPFSSVGRGPTARRGEKTRRLNEPKGSGVIFTFRQTFQDHPLGHGRVCNKRTAANSWQTMKLLQFLKSRELRIMYPSECFQKTRKTLLPPSPLIVCPNKKNVTFLSAHTAHMLYSLYTYVSPGRFACLRSSVLAHSARYV